MCVSHSLIGCVEIRLRDKGSINAPYKLVSSHLITVGWNQECNVNETESNFN